MPDLRASDLIPGVTHLQLQQFPDDRGFFMETWRASWLPESTFVQGNLSSSQQGVLRGLHYHLRQEDLWFIPRGIAWVALVDLRAHSPAYLQVETFELSGANAVHIPIGVAHGFYATDDLLMSYLVTGYYDGTDELSVTWDDPDIGISWPTSDPILSTRDQTNPRWSDVPPELRPSAPA